MEHSVPKCKVEVYIYTGNPHYEVVLERLDLSLCIFGYIINWGNNWYLISKVAMPFFNAVDASLSMIWKHGLIPRLFKYVVNYVKARIIYL